MTVSEYIEKFSHYDYNSLLFHAKSSLDNIWDTFSAKYGMGTSAIRKLRGILLTAMAYDGELTAVEFGFIENLLGASNMDDIRGIWNLRQYTTQEALDMQRDIINEFDSSIKAQFLIMITCCICCDGWYARGDVERVCEILSLGNK